MNLNFILDIIYVFVFFIVLYFTSKKFNYITNVIIYTIGRGLLPALFNFTNIGTLLITLIFRFVIGLALIKLLEKINDYFDSDVIFFIAGIVLEIILSNFALAFLLTFIHF